MEIKRKKICLEGGKPETTNHLLNDIEKALQEMGINIKFVNLNPELEEFGIEIVWEIQE